MQATTQKQVAGMAADITIQDEAFVEEQPSTIAQALDG